MIIAITVRRTIYLLDISSSLLAWEEKRAFTLLSFSLSSEGDLLGYTHSLSVGEMPFTSRYASLIK